MELGGQLPSLIDYINETHFAILDQLWLVGSNNKQKIMKFITFVWNKFSIKNILSNFMHVCYMITISCRYIIFVRDNYSAKKINECNISWLLDQTLLMKIVIDITPNNTHW